MPTFFQRPENALKRAKEFIAVDKKQQALDALYDVIKSKKHRTWQKIHEPIMEQYLDLCVELKKSHIAKEGLYQYKNICQQINIGSLVEVVRKYLALAEEKTEAARLQSHQAVVDVDDLEVIDRPENLLLAAVSGEDTQDRTDRAILTPWVKFLWESYRQCLDLLRNNNSVEKLYQDIAQNAFKFCLKYQRKTEFRKLCDNLRMHLNHIYKHQHQQRAINLNNPDSQAMHLETRLAQLDSAIQMELWQEAFKAVEDVHNLITMAKKSPKPSLMANYYQKLGLVFWKSGCHMFHACAWHRLFSLSREQRKNLSSDELQRLASRVLCATLAIPIPPSRNQIDKVLEMDDSTAEKQRRLAVLLGLQNPPTRAQLVKDLTVKFNVISYVPPELVNLYRWLEVEFHPLQLTERVQSAMESLKDKEELAQYVPALQAITVTRLIKQVSQVYQTIKFERLAELAPFASRFELERIIVDCGRTLELQVRIDHRTRSLSFGTNLGVAQKEDAPEGPYIQSMPSETIREQLTTMAQNLDQAVNIITPVEQSTQRDELRAHIVQCYRQVARKEHSNILLRRQIIEERKEKLENLNTQREREEQEQKFIIQREQYEAEMSRLAGEAEARERQRVLDEEKEISKKQAKERLEQLRQTPLGAKMIAEMDEDAISDLNMDEIVAKQIEQLEKEKKELHEKLRTQEKKVDYYERAKRVEEIPLLKKHYDAECVKLKAVWEQQEVTRIEQLKQDRELALSQRDRLVLMAEYKSAFVAKLQQARVSVYKERQDDWDKKYKEEKKKRLAERRVQRKEERRATFIREKEEEEQRKRDEQARREHEEQVAREQEEEQERLRNLEEIEERKRKKEAEIERKQIEEREKLRDADRERASPRREEDTWRRGPARRDDDRAPARRDDDRAPRRDDDDGPRRRGDETDAPASGAWKPKARVGAEDGGGGWRKREQTREDTWKRPSAEDDRGAPRRDDDRAPRRDDDRAPRRDDDRAPARDDGDRGGDTWRRGPARDDEPRRGPAARDDEPPRRSWRDDDRSAPPKRDFGDDSGPPRRDFGDDRGPPKRDFGRDDRGPRRDFGDDRGPRRDLDRDDRGPRRDFGRDRDSDRGAPRRDMDRDDRGPRRDERDDGPSWRRGGDAPKKEEGESTWRRGGDRSSPTKEPHREEPRREEPRQEEPRRAPPSESAGAEDDGWSRVAKKK